MIDSLIIYSLSSGIGCPTDTVRIRTWVPNTDSVRPSDTPVIY